jgi:hypothetical protein
MIPKFFGLVCAAAIATMPKALCAIAACMLLCPIAANASPYIVTLQEETGTASCGAGVNTCIVATSNGGSIDTDGLTNVAVTNGSFSQIEASQALTFIGTFAEFVNVWAGPIVGPTNFGSGQGWSAGGGSTGPGVGLYDVCLGCTTGPMFDLWLPQGYVSDTSLADTATWCRAT